MIETSAIYNYYFEINVKDETKYIGKDKKINSKINRENKNKISVNFNVPDWAKGKIMYHIFIDRFNRGSKNELRELPRRTKPYYSADIAFYSARHPWLCQRCRSWGVFT